MNRQRLSQRQEMKTIWLLKVGFVAFASLGIVTALLVQFFNAYQSRANTNIVEWIGGVSNDWQLDANWKEGMKPSKSDVVVIHPANFHPIVSRNIGKQFGLVKIKNGAKLTVQAQLLVAGNLEVEQNGKLLVQNGYLEIGQNLVVQKKAQVNQQNGELKVKGDYTLYGGIVRMDGGSLKARNDIELEEAMSYFEMNDGQIHLSGDLDCIGSNGESAFVLNGGEVAVLGKLRFYNTDDLPTSRGLFTINGGTFSANSIARIGQDVSFYKADANIVQTGGWLIFTDELYVLKSSDIEQSAGVLEIGKEVTFMEALTLKSIILNGDLTLSKPLELVTSLKMMKNTRVIGTGELVVGNELVMGEIVAEDATITKLSIVGKGVTFSGNCHITESISINGWANGSSSDKLVLSENAKCDFADGFFSNVKIGKQGGGTFQVPLKVSLHEKFLELEASGDLEIRHVLLTSNSIESDKSFVKLAQTSAWTIYNGNMQRGVVVKNIPDNLVLVGLLNDKWTALSHLNDKQIELPAEVKEVGFGYPVEFNESLSNVQIAVHNGNAHLTWDLTAKRDSELASDVSIKKWNGFEFSEIALIPASDFEYTEQLVDAENGTKYRIDLVNADGFLFKGAVLTLVIKPKIGPLAGIQSIYPSPFNSSITINFNALKNAEIQVQLVDLTGKVVSAKQQNVVNGNNAIAVNNLSQLRQGNYIIRVKSGEQYYSQPVAKR